MAQPLINIGDTQLFVVEQDITTSNVVVIVSSAGTDAAMRSGVSGAIRGRGGNQIEAELRTHLPLIPGTVIETSAGTWLAKSIYHAVVVGWKDEKRVLQATVWRVMSRSIALAQANKVTSIAFPSLGTGSGHADIYETHSTMAASVLDTLSTETSIKKIVFCFLDSDQSNSFRRALLQQQLVRQARKIEANSGQQNEQLPKDLTALWSMTLTMEAKITELSALVTNLEENHSATVINNFIGGAHIINSDVKVAGDIVGNDKTSNLK